MVYIVSNFISFIDYVITLYSLKPLCLFFMTTWTNCVASYPLFLNLYQCSVVDFEQTLIRSSLHLSEIPNPHFIMTQIQHLLKVLWELICIFKNVFMPFICPLWSTLPSNFATTCPHCLPKDRHVAWLRQGFIQLFHSYGGCFRDWPVVSNICAGGASQDSAHPNTSPNTRGTSLRFFELKVNMLDWYPHITLKLLNEKCLCINNVWTSYHSLRLCLRLGWADLLCKKLSFLTAVVILG